MLRSTQTPEVPTAASKLNDEMLRLLAKAVRGNERATKSLLLLAAPHVLRTVRRTLGSRHPDVEDTAQEAMLQLHGALTRFEGRSTVVHFVCRVALLTTLNVRRRESAAKRLAGGVNVETDYGELPSSLPTPETAADVQAQMELIRAALDVLPEPQAEALGQHCILGLTSLEIAETEGVTEEAVRSRLRAARRTLRSVFSQARKCSAVGEDFA